MTPEEYSLCLDEHLGVLVAFARQVNEVDLAGVVSDEFRGAQDAGWASSITAYEVFEEMRVISQQEEPLSKAEFRRLLLLYTQLSEAGGVYESLKNLMGVIQLKPYNMWPFQQLVRVKDAPRRVIGPNANAMFRDLATQAFEIGMPKLSTCLELAFRDDIRNGIVHADYVLWEDGLRMRRRNGGHAFRLSYNEVSDAINIGLIFFESVYVHRTQIRESFYPAKEIVGRFSLNPPFRMLIGHNPETGAFSISTSSPGPVLNDEYKKQEAINSKLGGKLISCFQVDGTAGIEDLEVELTRLGLEPHLVLFDQNGWNELLVELEEEGLWDPRFHDRDASDTLILSPWGFCYIEEIQHLGNLFDLTEVENVQIANEGPDEQ